MISLLRSLFQHRRLVRDLVARDLKARYVGSSMGFFWSVVFPIVNLFVYTFVFRLLLKTRWEDSMGEKETAMVMLAGILVWVAFAETLSRATICLVENANLIQKVVFPAEVLPPFLVFSALVNMLVGVPIVIFGCLAFANTHAGLSLVCAPLLLVLQAVFTVGLGYFLATFNLYLRDTYHVIGVFTNVWMFMTPIFYPARMVQNASVKLTEDPEGPVLTFAWLLDINPMYWLIESWRAVLVDGAWPDWHRLLQFAAVAVVVFAIGAKFFMSQKRNIPDLL